MVNVMEKELNTVLMMVQSYMKEALKMIKDMAREPYTSQMEKSDVKVLGVISF